MGISKPSRRTDKKELVKFRKRLSRFFRKGIFHSRRYRYNRSNNDRIGRLLKQVAYTIYTQFFQDDLKAPLNNPPKPALFQPASFNVYFGVNEDEETDGSGEVIRYCRTAYGMGTGQQSIRINPKTLRIYPMFASLTELMGIATELVKNDPQWRKVMRGRSFNFAAAKAYYAYQSDRKKKEVVVKDTGWHTDVTTDDDGMPCSDNSQVPMTPVAIFTFGDLKNLWFQQCYSRDIPKPNTLFNIPQENGSLFILDGKDEIPDKNGLHWRHMSNMPAGNGGVTMSFMFRVVQMRTWVYAKDHTLVNPPPLTPQMEQRFNRADKEFRTKYYSEQRAKLHDTFMDLFKRY